MEVGSKYGCLTILDLGEEYAMSADHSEDQDKSKLSVHYKVQCECGKIHYFDENTISVKPKYCLYPMFISSTFNYNIKSQNATYRKRKKYGNLMNVLFVTNRNECRIDDRFCGLYNQYKQKAMTKTIRESDEKRYTVTEVDVRGKRCAKYDVIAASHLAALKKVYPDDVFELCVKSDIRNLGIFYDESFHVEVSNHYGNSLQNKSRRYKRV